MTTALHINRVKAADISDEHRQLWQQMRRENSALYSPYFHPDYTQLLGQLHDDAYVAIIKSGDTVIGFLPFQQRKANGSARPIGAPMTDYHGIISANPLQYTMFNILGQSHISAFHMPSQMNVPTNSALPDEAACAVMNLTEFDTPDRWRESRDSSYRRHLKSLRRRIKKTESEHGVRDFIWQSSNPEHFDSLIGWKKQKFADTGKYDVLSVDWTLSLLKTLWQRGPEAPLRCDLQVMMVDGKAAAMDLGLTDGVTFHSWIVGYDNALHTLSPGMQLLERLVDEAPSLGYQNIDLGAGLEGYKKHYASWPHKAANQLWLGQGFGANKAKLYSKFEQLGQKNLKDLPGKLRRRYTQIAACDPSLSGQTKAMLKAIKNGG